MLDKLVDWLKDAIGWFKFAAVLHVYERGVLLRFGKLHSGSGGRFRPKGEVLEPGFYFHWPLKIEEVLSHHVVTDPVVMPEQSLTTKDQVSITLTPVVTFDVEDVRLLLLGVSTLEGALADSVSGVVSNMVLEREWDKIVDEDFAHEVEKKVRARAKRYGLKVTEVQFRDVSRCRTIRLIQGRTHSHE
ncbi:MAG: SPFH/Band 7/PHB domain protein [Thermoplasmata archaeon]|nr:SPFH/Band 7/PHB domain protein [Thermoplasmata archaeon]